MEMKTQSRVLPSLRCCLLGVPAWVVGRPVCRFVVRLVGHRLFLLRRRGTVSSLSGRRLPLLACLASRLGLRCRFGGVLASPFYKTGRAMLLRRSGGVGGAFPSVSRRRGVPAWFLLAPSYPYRRGGGCDAALACGRTGWRAWSALLLGDVAVVPSFLLIAPLLLSPHHDVLFFFFLSSFPFRPTLSSGVLSCLLASYGPPPPGRGMCERVIDLRLRAGRRFACFLSCRAALLLSLVRFRLACCSGLPLVSRFSSLPGSGLVRLRRVPSVSPCAFSSRAFLASLLLSAPSHLSGSVGSSSFACPSPLLGDSVAVSCHPIGVPPCFAPSASAFRRSLSARLVSSSRSSLSRRPPPRPDCRFACFANLGLVASRVGLALTVLVRFRSVSPITPPCLS